MEPEIQETTTSLAISVVIPTWNGLHLLRENLPAVQQATQFYRDKTGHATETIVVDDGSQDGTAIRLPLEFPEVRIVNRKRNAGFSAACNTGFGTCRFPIVALLNNDVRIEKKYFLSLAPHFEDPEVFAVTAKVFEWDHPIFATGGKLGRFRRGFWSVYFNYDISNSSAGNWTEKQQLLSVYAVGGFATYSREKLESLGGFNQLLSPFHWEDVDLSYRGWKRGWQIRYEPRSIAHHRTSATIKTNFRKNLVEEVSMRNRLLFHWINLSSPSYLIRHLIMLKMLLLTRIFVLDIGFYRSFFRALSCLDKVWKLRKIEAQQICKSDVEVSHLLKCFYNSAPIQIYYNQKDVIQKHPQYKVNTKREKDLGNPHHS